MRKLTKRSAALITAGVVAVGGAGAAYAAWSLSGSGTASAQAGTVVALEVSGASTTALVPGSTSDVNVIVTNKNKFPVLVKTISFTDFSSNKNADCTGDNIKQTKAAIPANLVIAAAGSSPTTRTISYPASLQMVNDPQEGCKEATFSFETSVGAESTVSNVAPAN